MRHRCVLIALFAAAIAVAAAVPQRSPARPRVILLSIDAGADWIFDELLARGKAPAFARMARDGARADAMVTVLPTLTAVSHASLWTGAPPRTHSISGNNVPVLPRVEHRVTEFRSGFENDGLTAEPIWMAAARQGRRVFIGQATAAAPFTTAWSDRLLMFDIYSAPLLPIELIEGEVGPDRPYQKSIGDLELSVRNSGDGQLDVSLGAYRGAMTGGRSGQFSPPIKLTIGGRIGYTRLRLIAYSPERGTFTMLRGRTDVLQSNRPERVNDLRAAAGTPVGENVSRWYARGRFGPTRADGGDGTAEEILAQIIEANHEYYARTLDVAAGEPWDLLVLYVPTVDIVAHALGGMIDPQNPSFRQDVAALIWPIVERIVLRTVDPYVATLRSRFPEATLIVGADHGIEGASRFVFPNVTLRKAGLLSLDAEGEIDVSRTKAVHLTSMAGSLFLNTTDWKDGIVRQEERAQLKREITAALLAIRDPSGTAPIRAVFDVEVDGDGLGVGGPASPDLYFDTTAGYTPHARLTGDAEVEALEAAGAGEHGNPPWHRNLQAIFFAVGPQVDRGAGIGTVRTIDVAATVARLLDIAPPSQSSGRVIPLGRDTR